MQIKINGQNIDRNAVISIDTSDDSDAQAWVIILAGAAAIMWILKDWRWW